MPKLTIKQLQADIATLRELRIEDKRDHERTLKETEYLKKRVVDIAAENESLRMDKKWLQQIHSALLQSIRFSGPKAL